ncbi:ABC transporter substrate-binding protein [Uruburuella testudinis]|uniref:ABC transporter substrate-binding protein n=1 Tax=Uruburuella testudinis TaxID=1282863 RepID=A0ABY4DPU4_9NEIS|nr:ABC transporter substrate-binding protein [Uruburuella testudinis]UOO80993.1 ABC transporter substrate-binding protein [Uruburuella testudinis]
MRYSRFLLAAPLIALAACSGQSETAAQQPAAAAPAATLTLEQIIEKARAEGRINSVGMPDTWANWKETWQDLAQEYGLQHQDTDMSSAQEIAKFAAEKDNATADIGDVGATFGPIALEKEVVQPYKPTTWDQIPDWAKDADGNWVIAYTGTIAFIADKQKVTDVPKSWADLKNSSYRITVGDVSSASQAVNGVLAANYALGGTEADLTPAMDYFADLAKQKRLAMVDPSLANLEKGEVEVAVVWDFNGLNYRDQIDANRFEVVIPSDGSVTSGYATIINKYAKHPHAAMLTREFILSDKGQLNLARGYARPIRIESLTIPAEVQAKLLPQVQYAKARPVADMAAWEKSAKALPSLWQQKVLINQ